MWNFLRKMAKYILTLFGVISDDCPRTIDDLPDKDLLKIFSHLDVFDRIRMERVCRRWQSLSKQSWKDVTTVHLSSFVSTDISLDAYEKETVLTVETTDTNVIRQLLSRCGRYVTKLGMEDKYGLFNTYTVSIISEFCRNLTSCRVELNSRLPSDSAVRVLLALNKNIRDLRFAPLHDITCLKLVSLRSLETLFLAVHDVTDKFNDTLNEYLAKCSSLHTLSVNFFNDETIRVLAERNTQLRNLTLVDMKSRNVKNSESLHYIATLTNLEKLSLWIPSLTDEAVLRIVEGCKQLQLVNIEDTKNVTQRGFRGVLSLSNLTKVDFCGNSGVTDDTLLLIPKTVTDVTLNRYTTITDDGIINLIRNVPNLEFLNIASCWSLTRRAIDEAVSITSERKNGKVLKLIISSFEDLGIPRDATYPFLTISSFH